MPWRRWILGPVLLALAAAGCRAPRPSALTIAGSTTILPFVEYLGEAYMAAHPPVRVNVQGGGSTAGIQAVRLGAADLGMSSRPLEAAETGLQTVCIAWEAIAVVVHRSNPAAGLSLEQVRAIFTGLVRDWSEVGGRRGPVTVISREEGSGTREAFEDLALAGRATSDRALVQDSNGAVREIVAADPAAIGYLSAGLVDERIRALPVDGRLPSAAAALAGQYRLVRPLLLVYQGEPGPQARRFIEYVLSPPAQALLAGEGLIPAAGEAGER